ncbi:hypothetical protein [Fibrivirga algicola]|uniref:Uncharacterized protein n=1 Tax=Fibrivirga algicola TaxID=2950420 RepID=A0ABX0QN75_9BACT|nr:hypothetical protein [Fibrivirga algicola]NID13789.1 hypothetical protein [Fibrivirga algicola]
MTDLKDSIVLEVADPDTDARLYVLLDTSDCAQVLPLYDGLSDNQKRAALSAIFPTAPAGYKAVIDNTCDVTTGGGGGDPDPDPDPEPVLAQSIGAVAYSFDSGGVRRRGFPMFDAVTGTSAPAITASNVYWVARASTGETASQALTRVRAGGVTKYPNSGVSAVRRSAVNSLTASTVKPAWLTTLIYRGDGKVCRVGIGTTFGRTGLKSVICNLDGSIITNSGTSAESGEYVDIDSFPLDGAVAQGSIDINGSPSGPVALVTGSSYLVSLEYTNGSTPEYFVYVLTIPQNPNDQITTLTLPGAAGGGGGSSEFVAHTLAGKRNMGLFIGNSNRDAQTGGLMSYERESVIWSKKPVNQGGAGMNCWICNIAWQKFQNPDGSFDFRMIDDALDISTANGMPMKLHFDMAVGLGAGNADSYLLASECWYDNEGNPVEKNDVRTASYSSQSARAKQATALNAAFAHVRDSGKAGIVMGFMVSNGLQLEHEFGSTNRVGSSNDVQVQFDFSDTEKAAFRTRAQGWYTTIWQNNPQQYASALAAANAVWGTSFTSWANVQPPTVPGGGSATSWNYNANQHTIDWYNHRQLSLADYANWWHNLVKAVSPNLKTMIKFGNLVDGQSQSRGTMSVAGLLLHDGISQDNDWNYNFKLSHTVALRSQEERFYAADEIFFVTADRYSKDQQKQWIRGAFDGGASFIDWGAFYASDPNDFNATKIAEARAWINEVMTDVQTTHPIGATITRPAYDFTITANSTTLLSLTWQNGGGGTSYAQQLVDAINQGKKPRFLINNNLSGV